MVILALRAYLKDQAMYPCGQYASQTLDVERNVNSLVCQPPKATENEELPLVGPHSNIHDGLVDYLRLSIVGRVMAGSRNIYIQITSCLQRMPNTVAYLDQSLPGGPPRYLH